MGIAIFDAAELAKENQRRHQQLSLRAPELERLDQVEFARLDRCRAQVYRFALVPFRDAFSRLKSVDLAELASIEPALAADKPTVELREVRIDVLGIVASMAGGLTAESGTDSAAAATVGKLAAVSTRTAISALSRATATTARGSRVLAAARVPASLRPLPALVAMGVFMELQGRVMLREQREVAAGLDQLEIAEKSSSAARARSEQVRGVLRRLQQEINRRLPGFVGLIDGNGEYATYTAEQREQVAVMVALVSTTVDVFAAPLIDEDGLVTDLSARIVEDAERRLIGLAA
ncbi:hypothetical protein [Blastococcus sp. PRF04-17]|uniref:hypothetical protein n=1 Tax=Blastococcus sp. PRF04-17 TaxID=2933797 RepID=UPI001FF4A8F4|nr:hypothetical protein [Blastococcus sp. PRF04-17]UOY03724.1 hypothetical protein MVA48_10495 [Blastococcus sp. PRF04-17]